MVIFLTLQMGLFKKYINDNNNIKNKTRKFRAASTQPALTYFGATV